MAVDHSVTCDPVPPCSRLRYLLVEGVGAAMLFGRYGGLGGCRRVAIT